MAKDTKEKGTKKKDKSSLLLILVFVVGFIILIYPSASNYYNQRVSSYMISNYDKSLENLGREDYEAMWQAAREYNSTVNKYSRAFINGASEDEVYLDTLNISGNMMGYIRIDKINVSLPVYHGTAEPVLQVGVGHLEGSELPTGDIGNHTVLTGHRGLPTAKLFTDLDKLDIGDTFVLTIVNETFTYKINQIRIVEPHELSELKVDPTKDLVTLVTCTPYGINSHRMLLQAERTENADNTVLNITADATLMDSLMLAPVIAIPILLILLGIVLFTTRKKKK